MIINFSPSLDETTPLPEVSIKGDVITINGESFDFSPLEEGLTLPVSAIDSVWIRSDVTRVSGEITLSLHLPHTSTASEIVRFPKQVKKKSGKLVIPSDKLLKDEE